MEENVELFALGVLLELGEGDDLRGLFCAHRCRWLAWMLNGRPSGTRSRKGKRYKTLRTGEFKVAI